MLPKIMFPFKKLVNLTLFLLCAALCTQAQTVLSPLGGGIGPFFNADGSAAALGKLYTCVPGSSCPGTPQASFTDSTGLTQNTNPVVLNSGGFPQNASGSIVGVWLTSGVAYKICLANSAGVQQWCADNVTGLATTQSSANQVTTSYPFNPFPAFTSLAQNQLFTMTLTGNVVASSLIMSGIATPATVTFELSQDGTGNRTFAWPGNFAGAGAIDLAPNAVTTQSFFWDGTTAYALSGSRSSGVDHGMPGEVRMYSGSTAPAGWLFCQGQAVSRLTYASLFSVVGTNFGAGDGSSTFNLPDLEGRVAVGAGQGSGLSNRALAAKGGEENHTLTVAEMPSHSHSATPSWSGGLPSIFQNTVTVGSGGFAFAEGAQDTLTINVGNTGGGAAHNNMPPYVVLNYICKY